MASLLYFNIQALPISNKDKLIGPEGYIKLFESLSSKVSKLKENKQLHEFGFALPHSELYFVPLSIRIEKKFIYGQFKKYDKVYSVQEFYSDEELYSVPKDKPATSKSWNMNYVFDPQNHILAIENTNNKLPKPSTLEEVLYHFIKEASLTVFPDHEITCNVLKENNKLDKVKKAESFKYINLTINYSNPIDSEDDLESLIDRENREASVGTVEVRQKASTRTGVMSKIPSYIQAMLNIASTNGDADIKYFDKDEKRWKLFSYIDFPIKIAVRHPKKSNISIQRRMYDSIKDAIKRTKNSE
ncbi:DUF4747 family protein [Alteromonas macleodii]|uniref:DUF4747 family protein n=1 Tax=Alteromonas macleodii TaxID=28108 RepID=UPI003BF7CB97